jgi:hypothetical protein
MRESGYGIGRECAASYLKSDKFSNISDDDVKPGDMINFGNHVGIVTEYDPETGKGIFVHMSGGNPANHGSLKISPFEVPTKREPKDKKNKNRCYYGNSRSIKAFRRIKEGFYSADIDLHKNGNNPNPVLQPIPEKIKKHADLATKLALNPNYIAPESPAEQKTTN